MPMKKFLNDPANLTAEMLEGLALAYSSKVKIVNDRIVVRAQPKAQDKVALVCFGGTGHEPAMHGFVGEGMADAAVAGDVFAAPGGPKVFEALEMLNRPAGVILLTLNHNGDRMSARKALRLAEKAGLNVKEIIVQEDIAPGIDADPEDRRGLGGCIPLMKVMGAACEEGKSIDEVLEIGKAFHSHLATLSVALKVATHPQNGGEIGSLADDEMEIGMGQHGEGGGGIMKVQTADETARIMVDRLVQATGLKSGDRALLVINGSGATTTMEMLICYRAASKCLAEKGITLMDGIADELLTVQEMAGFQMILAKVCPTCEALLKAKANTPYWTCNG